MRADRIQCVAFTLLAIAMGATAMAQETMPAPSADSLIQPNSYRGLVADRRAHRLGDTLTVIVVEAASASATANTGAFDHAEVNLTGFLVVR